MPEFALTSDEQRRFENDTRKKIVLEKKLAAKFRTWGLYVANRAAKERAFNGAISHDLRDALWQILREHYITVMDRFLRYDFKAYAESGIIDEPDDAVRSGLLTISADLAGLILTRGRASQKSILETTTKNIMQAIEAARDTFKSFAGDIVTKQEPPQPEVVPTVDEVMAIARRLLIVRLNHRANLIGITETQWAAEGAKYKSVDHGTNVLNVLLRGINEDMEAGRRDLARRKLESAVRMAEKSYTDFAKSEIEKVREDVEQGRVLGRPRQVVSFKAWVTRMDKRVRATHRLALGQRVRNDEPFLVGNSKLMYPGDRSLNAEKDETARCRCWVIYN
jgi:hypothetical protein